MWLKNSIIKIPICDNGSFDLQAQKLIAQKHLTIEQIKSQIEVELIKIEKLVVIL